MKLMRGISVGGDPALSKEQQIDAFFLDGKMKFKRLLGNRVLVSPLPAKQFSDGGIVLPQGEVGDVMHYWRVEQYSDGAHYDCGTPVRFGDIIITPLHFSHTTLEDGSNRKILDCDQIIGKFEELEPDL